jgi:hypothetical protein
MPRRQPMLARSGSAVPARGRARVAPCRAGNLGRPVCLGLPLRPGLPGCLRRLGLAALVGIGCAAGSALAQTTAPGAGAAESSAPQALSAPTLPERLVVSRNIFDLPRPGAPLPARPEVALGPGAELTLTAQRVLTAPAQRLTLVSPDPAVTAVLRFRRMGGDLATRGATAPESPPAAWSLTVVLIARPRSLDYSYLADGQRVVDGRIEPQRTFRIDKGLETGLAPAGGVVGEIVIQDEGDAELRLKRDGDSLQLSVVPPAFGGEPSGTKRPWYAGEPLRFLDYQVLFGGYAAALFKNDYTGFLFPGGTPDHGVAEVWLANRVGLRAAGFVFEHESIAVEQLVVTQQAARGEHWALWAEAGAAASQHSLAPAQGAASTRSVIGWTAGVTGHLRFNDLGAMVHWADTDGPSITQVMAGWQATRRVGLAVSWISYRTASATGLVLAVGF